MAPPDQSDHRLPGAAYATELLRQWRTVVLTPLIAGVVVAIIVLLLPVRFTSTASFVPESGSEPSLGGSLGSIASSFGIPTDVGPGSPHFYAALAISRPVLTTVVTSEYPDPKTPASSGPANRRSLIDIYDIDTDDPPAMRLEAAVAKLAGYVDVRIDERTGVVTIGVDAQTPSLAADVARRLLEVLDRFNVETRQTRAGSETEFIERRLTEVRAELGAAESTLVRFYSRNRDISSSPSLLFEEARLRREFDFQSANYASLSQQYETAHIQQIRNTPVLTVLAPPIPPTRKSFPKRTATVMTAIALATFFALIYVAFDLKRRQAAAEYPEEVREISVEWRRTRDALGSPLRRLIRRPPAD